MATKRTSVQPLLAGIIGGVILVGAVGTLAGWWRLNIIMGEFTLAHWIGWTGGGIIAVLVPAYSLAKRAFGIRSFAMMSAHVFTNLTAFGLVVVHFSYQLSRPAGFGPDWGTGLGLLIAVTGIVITGIVQRFGLAPGSYATLKKTHIVLALALLVVLPLHVMKNLGVF